jgi:Ran GTPase-activating protein (RanGAP) involved in mRNA processing and transport
MNNRNYSDYVEDGSIVFDNDQVVLASEVASLFEYIRNNPEIKALCITSTGLWGGLSSEAIYVIANELASNSTLEKLDLTGNKIRDEGASAIAKALKNNNTLTSLSLRGNKLSDKGIESIAHALLSNTLLTALDLACNNKVSKNWFLPFESVLLNNYSLIEFDFCSHHWETYEDHALISELLEKNKNIAKVFSEAAMTVLLSWNRGNKQKVDDVHLSKLPRDIIRNMCKQGGYIWKAVNEQAVDNVIKEVKANKKYENVWQ